MTEFEGDVHHLPLVTARNRPVCPDNVVSVAPEQKKYFKSKEEKQKRCRQRAKQSNGADAELISSPQTDRFLIWITKYVN